MPTCLSTATFSGNTVIIVSPDPVNQCTHVALLKNEYDDLSSTAQAQLTDISNSLNNLTLALNEFVILDESVFETFLVAMILAWLTGLAFGQIKKVLGKT